jgi:hypothetical protein
MDKSEAKRVLLCALAPFREKSHAALVEMIETEPVNTIVQSESAASYQIEIQVFWDGWAGGDVLVLGAIDDGGWRAFVPLKECFIKSPLNMFVGE